MKKNFNWILSVSVLLISASALAYTIHYLIFRDLHHIFIYMIGDIAFLFIDVLLVILFIERLLSQREKRTLINKLNMVIGIFFSEVGLELLRRFSTFILNSQSLEKVLEIRPEWQKRDFKKAAAAALSFSYEVKLDKKALAELRDFLLSKRSFMLQLLENPNLLEHERFTDLLWAIFHLNEELSYRREKLGDLPEVDYQHLAGDLKRAYSQITTEWIFYTEHLRESYPFLYSLAARVNPMNPNASPVMS